MNNNNENKEGDLIPMNNEVTQMNESTIEESIPDWVIALADCLEINPLEVLKKQAESTDLVSDEEKADAITGLVKIAEISKGYFTENELIFMYLISIKNLMNLSAELRQVKSMLAMFSNFTPPMSDDVQ